MRKCPRPTRQRSLPTPRLRSNIIGFPGRRCKCSAAFFASGNRGLPDRCNTENAGKTKGKETACCREQACLFRRRSRKAFPYGEGGRASARSEEVKSLSRRFAPPSPKERALRLSPPEGACSFLTVYRALCLFPYLPSSCRQGENSPAFSAFLWKNAIFSRLSAFSHCKIPETTV